MPNGIQCRRPPEMPTVVKLLVPYEQEFEQPSRVHFFKWEPRKTSGRQAACSLTLSWSIQYYNIKGVIGLFGHRPLTRRLAIKLRNQISDAPCDVQIRFAFTPCLKKRPTFGLL